MKIGFISDAHGHAMALSRGLELMRRFSTDQTVFLGDAVGYVPGLAAADLVHERRLTCVMGNHDAMVLDRTTPPDRESIYQHESARAEMTREVEISMSQWPKELRLADGCVLAVHGSPLDPLNGYIYADTNLGGIATRECIVVMGHTHRPFVRRVGERLFVNAGSCALPRDTGGFGAFAIVDTERHEASILRFDIRDLADIVINRFSIHPTVVEALRRPVADNFEGEVVHV